MKKKRIILLLPGLLLTFAIHSNAYPLKTGIDTEERSEVVNALAEIMIDNYIFPDKGKEMADLIIRNMNDGKYDQVSDPVEFSKILSNDLVSVNNDLHLSVRYAPERIGMMRNTEINASNKELEELQTRLYEYSNYGFEEVKILPGNVGYLKFNNFRETLKAGPVAVAAMNFLVNADALIIDLTENGGGRASMVQLISTYLLEENELLQSLYFRKGDRVEQFWTLPYVPGEKLDRIDLYILTSTYTFSAAEAFAYSFQKLGRAVIIGETTAGGAHPVDDFVINDNFIVRVPFARTINPITSDNWEGTGVIPDIQTAKGKARNMAYMMALDSLMKKEENESILAGQQWAFEGLKAEMEPISLPSELLEEYVGTYGPRKLTLENGDLYYQRDDMAKMKMHPITEVIFGFSEVDYFRLKVIVEEGRAVALEGYYDNGASDRSERTH